MSASADADAASRSRPRSENATPRMDREAARPGRYRSGLAAASSRRIATACSVTGRASADNQANPAEDPQVVFGVADDRLHMRCI